MARHHDLVIIGTGSGNSLITPELSHLDIALVEHGRFGGTCLNVGCIPTKMYVYPSELITMAHEAGRVGVDIPSATGDWRAVRDRVFARVDAIADGGERYRREDPAITVYDETARFVGPKQLDTGSAGVITADRFVIAAGSRPRLLDIPGLGREDPSRAVYTSDTIMRIDEVPARIAIVGGGFIAAEFAHVLSSFGAQVSWIHRGKAFLDHHDEIVSSTVTTAARQQYDVKLLTTVTAATRDESGWHLTLLGPEGEQSLDVDAVLLAVGRIRNSDLLDVSAAGVEVGEGGQIVVDEFQRTSVPGIFALGDISSDYQLKHVANHEARTVAHNLAHPDDLIASDHRFVPHGVFGHPQVASFGPTEAELVAAGSPYVVKTQVYGDTAYGWAMEDLTSRCKVIADPHTKRLFAAHLVGPHATSLIQPLIQAASLGTPVPEVARGQYWIHPALAEVVENALLGLDFSAPA